MLKVFVDGSKKNVYKKYFVENQTSMASAKFLETVDGHKNVNIYLLKECLELTPEVVKIAKSVSKQMQLSKVDSNSAQGLICHYFPKSTVCISQRKHTSPKVSNSSKIIQKYAGRNILFS